MSQDSATSPEQPISHLTVADLEALVTAILQKLLSQPTPLPQASDAPQSAPSAFLETFGAWEDAASPEHIIEDIYAQRTTPPAEAAQ
jgi:hypothetical protein